MTPLEFMVGGYNQIPGLSRKVLASAPPLLAEGSWAQWTRSA